MSTHRSLAPAALAAATFALALFAAADVPPASGAAAKAAAPAKAEKAAKAAKADKAEEKKWDVNNPPGEWRDVAIDTTETTWSTVDVSPDGETIVFDMLGDLYTVPMTGGEAKSLTSGIA